MLYVNLLFNHKHMVRLSGKLHLNYYVLCPTYACSCRIRFRSGFEFRILPLSKIRFRMVRSIFSHFMRKDTSHLSKTVSGLFGRYDYSVLEDKTKIFFTKYFLLNSLTAMVAYLRPLFFRASCELNNFSNFCPLTTFDS
jgi:hypothetical protein